ncbi:MAG: branched-chain amino acid ABC transporter permease [Pseudomonadota bacterium]
MIYVQLLIDSLLLGGLYALMALGLALSFGVTNILNFAHGEAIMLGAYGAFFAFSMQGIDPLVSLPFLMVIGFCAGYLLFRYFLKRVLTAPQINQILLTFGLGMILNNAAAIAFTADMRSANPSYASASIRLGEAFLPMGRLIAFGVALIMAGALLLWLHRTEYGRACRAVAQNQLAATLAGIDLKNVYAVAFGISIAIGVATGVVLSWVTPVTPFMGFHLLVKAFAIIILGGIGSIGGAMVGAFLLGFLETAVAYFVPDGIGWAEGVAFAVLFLILIFRPRGIAGRTAEG